MPATKARPPKRPARSAPPARSVPKEQSLAFYRQMVFVRRFEERAARAYTEAKIGGYCHLNLGEEATVAGLIAAMAPDDYLFTNYREHGYALARGIAPERVMAELYGRSDGVSKGWGGSMHMFDLASRFMGGYGIVGGQLPLATGAALAIDYRDGGEAVVCLMGDGTTNIGAFHESLNLAALWGLPIVYVVVNNGLGMGTTVEQSSAEPELYKRAGSYGWRPRGSTATIRPPCTTACGPRFWRREPGGRTCWRLFRNGSRGIRWWTGSVSQSRRGGGAEGGRSDRRVRREAA